MYVDIALIVFSEVAVREAIEQIKRSRALICICPFTGYIKDARCKYTKTLADSYLFQKEFSQKD